MKTPSYNTIVFEIPACWTPEQALAVFDLVDQLRDKIWDRYNLQLQEFLQEQQSSSACDHPLDRQAELPF